jgi:short-subunit dehydrogenase
MNVNNKFHPYLEKNGKIIIVTSEVAPFDPLPFNGLYNVSKTALDSYAQALRQELNLLNQKVITIRPGSIKTPLSDGSLTDTAKLSNNTILYKKQANKFLKLTKKFMGKTVSPKKVGNLIVKIIEKKNPKIIYRINLNILLSLLNLLPKRIQCFIIKKILN